MKGKKYLFIGLVLGTVLGWALGFLRLPYIEKNRSFLLGFMVALAFVSLVLTLLTAWNRNVLSALMGKRNGSENSKTTDARAMLWTILVGILVLGSVVSGLIVSGQNAAFQSRIQQQDKQIQDMAALLASGQKSELAPLMRSILDDVAEELKRSPGRTLRDTTIARIAALSFAFNPYKLIENDSLSERAFSPERGQLLQALILLNIDSGTFARIKRSTLFDAADLRGADLKGLDLSDMHLQQANLKGADLSGANLDSTDLGAADLWGANLNQANLSHTDLKRADLRWAKLNAANLSLANLNGANLSNAQLRKADLTNATFQRAQSVGALFNEAMLFNTDLAGTNLTKVNLSQANLIDTDLRSVNFSQAVLVGVQLNKAVVSKNWPETLKQWQPTGMQELQDSYTVVNDTADKWKAPLYRLKKN